MTDPLSLVQSFYAALAAGNPDAAFALLDPAIEWTETKGTPYDAGTMRGVEAVVTGLFAPLGQDFSSFAAVPHEFVVQGGRVISLGTYTGVARSTGNSLSTPFAHSWTVSGERITRFDQYTDSAAWNEALAS